MRLMLLVQISNRLQDKATWLAITAPEVIANYTDYPAVGTLTISSPASIFDHSFDDRGLGDKRCKLAALLNHITNIPR
jgi:hypothetical protein